MEFLLLKLKTLLSLIKSATGTQLIQAADTASDVADIADACKKGVCKKSEYNKKIQQNPRKSVRVHTKTADPVCDKVCGKNDECDFEM